MAKELTLDEAVNIALIKSENIQQSLLDMELAQEQVEEAWSSVYPQISAQVQGIRHTKAPVLQFNGTSVPVKQDWELLSSLQINQVIYSFGRVGSALKMAKLSSKVQKKAKEVVEREIRYAVELSYYNVQLAQNILKISQDSLENAKKNQQALQKRFQGGRVPRLDNLRMESEIASRKPVVSNAKKSLDLAYLQLNLFLKNKIDERPVLTTKLESSFASLNESSLKKKTADAPQIKLSELQVDLAVKQVDFEKSYHYPTISAFGNVSHNGTGDTMPPDDDNLFTSTSIGLMINIPLYEGGAVSSRTRQKVLKRRQAQIKLQKQVEDLEMKLQSSIVEYKTNLDRLKSAKEAVNLSKQAYYLTRSRYETGGATRNDLNDSERSLTSARIQVETIMFEIYQNKSDIRRITEKVAQNG
tara:strand:+ start:2172 stop:3416 length:1245 start_codon:yes stop_codon:yes gene_type:complete